MNSLNIVSKVDDKFKKDIYDLSEELSCLIYSFQMYEYTMSEFTSKQHLQSENNDKYYMWLRYQFFASSMATFRRISDKTKNTRSLLKILQRINKAKLADTSEDISHIEMIYDKYKEVIDNRVVHKGEDVEKDITFIQFNEDLKEIYDIFKKYHNCIGFEVEKKRFNKPDVFR